MADDSTLFKAVNNWSTTLTNDVTDTDTTITLDSVAGLPTTGGVLTFTDTNEIVHYTSISGNDLTVERGYDGTTAASHSAGQKVEMRWIAAHHNVLKDEIISHEDASNPHPQSKLLQAEDIFADFVVSGLLPATSSNLTSDISAGVAYVTGVRVVKAVTSHTYTASKDTYVDLDSTGTYTFVEVANGDTEPAVTTDSIRLAKVVTDATAITTVTTMANVKLSISKHVAISSGYILYFGNSRFFESEGSLFIRASSVGNKVYVSNTVGGRLLNYNVDASVFYTSKTLGVGTPDQFGGGAPVIGIANATTVPSSNPTGGGVLYVENGALKYRNPSGDITSADDINNHLIDTTNPHSVTKEQVGAIGSLVEDTTPQLGGDLDTNGKHINAINQISSIDNQSKLLQTEDLFADFVVSGLLPATSTTLTSDISAGTAYVSGVRVVKATTSHTYTASKDTYVDISSTGTYTFTEVANGDPAPAIATDSIRLAKVVTDASTISSVTDLANRQVGTSASEFYVDTSGDNVPVKASIQANNKRAVQLIITDKDTDLTTNDFITFYAPTVLNGKNLVRAKGFVETAGSTDDTTVQVRNLTKYPSNDSLSTAITIASGSTSGSGTVDTSYDDVSTDDKIKVYVTAVSSTAPKGLTVVLEYE